MDHNLGLSDERLEELLAQQMQVDSYKLTLENELREAFQDPEYSWLSLFRSIWREPETYGLETEEEAREFAIFDIWQTRFPNELPPQL